MVAKNDVAGLLAADVAALLAHRLEHVAVADRRALQADAFLRQPPLKAEVGHDRRDDRPAAQAAPRRARSSATSAISWSPSMIRPFSSTTISRSASPSSARPMSAPHATTVSRSSSRMGRAATVVDVEAVGFDAERDDVRAELPQRLGRDMVGGAIGAIDDDLQAVEAQPIGEGRLGEVDVAPAGVVDALGAADHFRLGELRPFSSRRSMACSASSLSL